MTTDPVQLLTRFERLARHSLAGLALLILALAVYMPGLASIAPVDRDESRFAQASRQMFESVALPSAERKPELHDGGLVVPKVAGKPRLNKPPLIYWAQSASAAIFTNATPARDAIWMYRLPSALAATLTALLVWRFGASMFDAPTGLLAAAMLTVCPMILWDAHQARADQLLLFTTTSAMFALWVIFRTPGISTRLALWLWVSVALGILTKGPITPMVAFLTAIALAWARHDWIWLRRTRPIIGLVVLAGMLGPWVLAVINHVGASVFWNTLFDETLGRSAGAKEGHWGPPGYHTVLLAILFWPGSMLTLAAFIRTFQLAIRWPVADEQSRTWLARLRSLPRRLKQRTLGRDAELFIVAWIIPSWVVFELVATKLPHYTLPMYPAIALISAKAVLDAARARVDAKTADRLIRGLNIWLVIGLAICVIVPVGLALLGGNFLAIAAAAMTAILCTVLLVRARNSAIEGLMLNAQLAALAASVLFAITTLGVILPRASLLWVWTRTVSALPQDQPVAVAGPFEDSAVFLTRAQIQHIARDQALNWARKNPEGVIIMERKDSTAQLDLERIGTFAGYDYAAGRFVTLDLVRDKQ